MKPPPPPPGAAAASPADGEGEGEVAPQASLVSASSDSEAAPAEPPLPEEDRWARGLRKAHRLGPMMAGWAAGRPAGVELLGLLSLTRDGLSRLELTQLVGEGRRGERIERGRMIE